jgi:hypothetical protein
MTPRQFRALAKGFDGDPAILEIQTDELTAEITVPRVTAPVR